MPRILATYHHSPCCDLKVHYAKIEHQCHAVRFIDFRIQRNRAFDLAMWLSSSIATRIMATLCSHPLVATVVVEEKREKVEWGSMPPMALYWYAAWILVVFEIVTPFRFSYETSQHAHIYGLSIGMHKHAQAERQTSRCRCFRECEEPFDKQYSKTKKRTTIWTKWSRRKRNLESERNTEGEREKTKMHGQLNVTEKNTFVYLPTTTTNIGVPQSKLKYLC